MAWRFNEHTPVYIQIADRLRGEIIKGMYAPGDQIPPVRQLAVMAAVNPNTVQRALLDLEAEGLLRTAGTNGRFVTDDTAVLANTKTVAARELVQRFLEQAAEISIHKTELIHMIEEAEI